MSMMAIMSMIMSEESNESAKGTESPSRRRQPPLCGFYVFIEIEVS